MIEDVDDLTDHSLEWIAMVLREWLSHNETALRIQATTDSGKPGRGWDSLIGPMTQLDPAALQAANQWLTSAAGLLERIASGSVSHPRLTLAPKTEQASGADVERDELAAEIAELDDRVGRLELLLEELAARKADGSLALRASRSAG